MSASNTPTKATTSSSSAPTTPVKTSLKIGPKAVVCQEAQIVGDVTIEEGTVVHPKAVILAEGGPIIIGPFNIIEEQAVIRNRIDPTQPNDEGKTKIMKIGSHNLFEVGSTVEAISIGNYNVIEARVKVHANSVIQDSCIIGAATTVFPNQVVETNTIIWGPQNHTRIQTNTRENHQATHTRHLEILWKTLPNFHHIKKA